MRQNKIPEADPPSTTPRTKRIGSRKRKLGEGTTVTSRYFQSIAPSNGSFRFANIVSPDPKIRSKRTARTDNRQNCNNAGKSGLKIASETAIVKDENDQTLGYALFAENRSDICANGATSDYFLRSPSSAYGSVRSLGPLVYTWIDSTSRDEIRSNCSRRLSCPGSHGIPCDACSKILRQDAFRHFRDCPIFRQNLASYDWISGLADSSDHVVGKNSHPTCVEVVGRWAEEHALRHLCPNQCFLRAFAPRRDWMSLRRHLKKITPIGETLNDWTCRLVHETNENEGETFKGRLPRTIFVSLNSGESFASVQKGQKHVLDENECQTTMTNQIVFDHELKSLTFDENYYKTTKLKIPSPFGLVEELFPEEPWRILICTMLLNKTQRKQNLDSILYHLFKRWPTADAVVKDAEFDEEDVHLFVFALVRPAGLGQAKARAFVQLSRDYLLLLGSKRQGIDNDESCTAKGVEFELTREDVKQLFNCGDYAADAYQIFIRKDFESPVLSNDQMLLAYAEWKRSLSCVT